MVIYYKAMLVKKAWYQHKTDTLPVEQRRDPRNQHKHLQPIIFDKMSSTCMGEKSLPLINELGN
jgi:hypothetical protein